MPGSELKINVGDLDAGGKRFTFPLRAAWIRGILEDHEATATGSDGELDVRASRSGNDVVIHGTLKAELEIPCARCLAPVALHVDQQLSLLFVPGKVTPPPVAPAPAAGGAAKERREPRDAKPPKPSKKKPELEEYELSPEDADTLPYDGELVVLDDVVRDELILETPIFPLCSEDCPGMSARPLASPDASADEASGMPSETRHSGETDSNGDEPEHADIDPRLRPLLRLKGELKAKRD